MNLFENAVLLLLRRRMERKIFERADISATICHPSEHVLGSSGIMRGHFVCLFSNFNTYRFRVDGDIFENATRIDADIYHPDKGDAFRKHSNTCGRGLNVFFFFTFR